MEKETQEIIYFTPDGSLDKSFRVRIVVEIIMLAIVVFIIMRYKPTFWTSVGIVVASSLTSWLLAELISPMKKTKKIEIEV